MPPGYRRANKAGHCGHAMPINAVLFLHPMFQPSYLDMLLTIIQKFVRVICLPASFSNLRFFFILRWNLSYNVYSKIYLKEK